ncbi:hypothetical protein CBM2606_A10094 [Cupriavidus taiwanensis]|nr:hypothetical protein CBM2606_A10094 [Cupriavidus taiwanensis]
MPTRPRRCGGSIRPRSWYERTLRTVVPATRASSSMVYSGAGGGPAAADPGRDGGKGWRRRVSVMPKILTEERGAKVAAGFADNEGIAPTLTARFPCISAGSKTSSAWPRPAASRAPPSCAT